MQDGGIKRDEKGRLAPGTAPINPEGNNGHLKGWQKYGDRLQTWLDKTGEDIQALFDNDGAELKKRSVIDIACAQHARQMISGDAADIHRAREAALDRIEGKPKQTVAHGGDPDNPNPINMAGEFTLTFGTEQNADADV